MTVVVAAGTEPVFDVVVVVAVVSPEHCTVTMQRVVVQRIDSVSISSSRIEHIEHYDTVEPIVVVVVVVCSLVESPAVHPCSSHRSRVQLVVVVVPVMMMHRLLNSLKSLMDRLTCFEQIQPLTDSHLNPV